MKNLRSALICNNPSHKVFLVLFLLSVLFAGLNAQTNSHPAIGQWDITVDLGNNITAPSWLEVKLSGIKTLAGHFVSAEGSARPVSEIKAEGQKITFSIPPQWEFGINNLVFEGTVENDALSGTITYPNGKQHPFTGVRAPAILPQ